ncbi:hypothetical protein M426DRAFT_12997 [Hypoxylon sp. CI-4A]|nr:hypothetical protein M426DRAFT_12997 [Hypoxylon sp. CI-4A]
MDQADSASPSPTLEISPPFYNQYLEEGDIEDAITIVSPPSPVKSILHFQTPPPETMSTSGPFPSSWNLYHTLSVGKALTLGPHGREPLFAVSKHSGWWTGLPDLVLHRGPSDAFPPLAVGMGGIGVGRHSIIVLPPLPESGLESSQEILLRIEEKTADRFHSHVRFRFAIEVGEPGRCRREIFEWRHSHGDVVADFLDGAKNGWKLLRITDQDCDDLEEPSSTGGHEIVAVWAYAKLSVTKVLKFRYLGSGASGDLGDRWNIMAAMTALRMYQRQHKHRNGDW